MKKYTFEEFKSIIKNLLISQATNNTFADNIESFLKGDNESYNSFYVALNGTNNNDENILECEDILQEVLNVKISISTYCTISEMYEEYLNLFDRP